jgi:hypothetical protein
MKFLSSAVIVAVLASPAVAFTSNGASRPLRQQTAVASTPPAGFGDYLAKAHEEKLRAVKEVETKKNVEIAVSLSLYYGRNFQQENMSNKAFRRPFIFKLPVIETRGHCLERTRTCNFGLGGLVEQKFGKYDQGGSYGQTDFVPAIHVEIHCRGSPAKG